mmetsp:Transcript_4499/g.6598  ORF Transcript_4499/g.6598 Transcript_4499/m.6598 type:complete len:97 (-) Transcript_4499:34-324(-)
MITISTPSVVEQTIYSSVLSFLLRYNKGIDEGKIHWFSLLSDRSMHTRFVHTKLATLNFNRVFQSLLGIMGTFLDASLSVTKPIAKPAGSSSSMLR